GRSTTAKKPSNAGTRARPRESQADVHFEAPCPAPHWSETRRIAPSRREAGRLPAAIPGGFSSSLPPPSFLRGRFAALFCPGGRRSAAAPDPPSHEASRG